MKIGAAEFQASYCMGKRVYDGVLTKEAGAKALRDQHGMNLGSARDYIKAFHCLTAEELFTRTISAPAADYYFSQMLSDYGHPGLAKALQSMEKHIKYFEGASKREARALRYVLSEHQVQHQAQLEVSGLEARQNAFEARVAKSRKDSPEDRAARLKLAPPIPKQITISTQYFLRNPDVVVEVLLRAAGICECCNSPAPFTRRADTTPYLEVHHRKQLASGGYDTVANAVAVCPNCHRKAHYGLESA